MLILLIEDDAFKAKRLCAHLRDKHKVCTARSVSSGLARLFEAPKPDLLLLDMSLSTYDVGVRETGGRPQNFGGVAVLEHMLRRHLLVPVIVITQFEVFPKDDNELTLADVRKDLSSRFSYIFRGLIYYSSRETQWEMQLDEMLKNLASSESKK